jgi:hypothetical protein
MTLAHPRGVAVLLGWDAEEMLDGLESSRTAPHAQRVRWLRIGLE